MAKNKQWDTYLHGMFKWVRTPNLDQYGNWSAQCYPTPESLEIVRDLQAKGLKNRLKKDDDGYFISIKCQPSKDIGTKTLSWTAPVVLDGRKKLADGTFPPLLESVGNGSTGVAKMETYEHGVPGTDKKSVAWRWRSLLVNNLVEYQTTRDFGEEELQQVAGLESQKEQLF